MINEEKYLEWMEEYFNSPTADENIDSELTVKYDISKVHITEKAMDIKIY